MSDKPLYDELMNLVTEIGELEVENGLLKKGKVANEKSIKSLNSAVYLYEAKLTDCKNEIIRIHSEKEAANRGLIAFRDAKFLGRLRYLFTRKL